MNRNIFKIILPVFLICSLIIPMACTPTDPITDDIYVEGDLYVWDGAAWVAVTGGGGAADFTDLGDTPANYVGSGGEYVRVNVAENALEFNAAGAGAVATDAIWDAKGDLAGGTGADTAAKLTVGANDTVLTAASGEATGLKWASAGAGDVTGPAASTDNMIARHDGAGGKTLQDYTSNPPTVSDTGDMNIDGDLDVENIVVSGNVDGVDVSAHASRHEAVGADQIHSIADDDDDTKIQVEESADEDIIRMDTAGAEAFKLSAAGILTLAKQSSAKIYSSIPHLTQAAGWLPLILDTDDYDIQNESDVSIKVGTADATEALKLHDADGGFEAGDVGSIVWNTTDDTFANVSAFVDSGELTLSADIFVNGEAYRMGWGKITVTEDGLYLIVAQITIDLSSVDGEMFAVSINAGGATAGSDYRVAGGDTASMSALAVAVMILSASDVVRMLAFTTTQKSLYSGAGYTYLSVTKIG